MAKKKKIKKSVWIVLVIVLFLIIGSYSGVKVYQKYQYKKTYEYKLIEHGYTLEEAQKLQKVFNEDDEFDYLLSIEKNDNIIKLLDEKYFLKKNFQNYLTYMDKSKDKNLSEIVRNINIHLDQDFYEISLKTDVSKDDKMIVNKFYQLDSSYLPDDLVTVPTTYAWGDYGNIKIRKIAYDAFLDMWNAANQDGYYLMINSAYRTYEEQETVYNNYKESRGQKYADGIAARPGSSEHQTGLCLDIFSKNNSNKNTFGDTEEAKWLKDNAHKYGFILRYPEDKVDITGYNFESWHYRYIGIDAATYCYENDITYEEYYAYFIES